MRILKDDDKGQLVLAVYLDDRDRAIEAITMLAARSGKWARLQQIARATANPPAPLPPIPSFALPQPGHIVGSTLGDPRFSSEAAA